MTIRFGEWIIGLDGAAAPARELVGGKAWSVARMLALGLSVPPAFVITTRACAAYLASGALAAGLDDELAAAIAWLEIQSGRRFGAGPRPLLVSVRSGAPVSMPGMMDTVLNLGVNDATEAALAEECRDADFARNTHRRFLDLYASIVLKTSCELTPDGEPRRWRAAIAADAGEQIPDAPFEQLRRAVRAVFESWNSRRARRYRQHHGIADDLGTAVAVQAMVFGNLDASSGTGVVFSRNPLSGDPAPYGEYLPRAQGEDVVSGKFTPRPLAALAAEQPEVHAALVAAAKRLEAEGRDVQDIEFTVERGKLFFLQSRAAKLAPHAAARIAVDLEHESLIDEAEALMRVTPDQVRLLLSPHIAAAALEGAQTLAQGEGASPGVGIGAVVGDSDEAETRARSGEAVILARPTTSPEDLHGMIAAKAIVTETGGSTSHAAVVGRALGLPCVVGCGKGALEALRGRVVTVDGAAGKVYAGALAIQSPDADDNSALAELTRWALARTPLRVVPSSSAEARSAFDLSADPAALDPATIGAAIKALAGVRGASGGAVASPEGVRAALAAGLEFIVADPILPPLLIALGAAGGAASTVETERT